MTAPTRRGETRQQRGDETRAAIIAETVACILEEGFGAASAKHITERAGVSWGVIQYHFGDRDQLLMAVVETAWPAFSNPTSMAAQEILVATRVGRNRRLNRHLAELNAGLDTLGAKLVPDGDGAAIGGVIWACLRGWTLPQMVSAAPYDSSRQRQTLIDMLTLYLSARTVFEGRDLS